MSTKRFEYLRDLTRFNAPLTAKCRSCGHEGQVDPVVLMLRKEPGNTPIEKLAERLKCSACGERDVEWWPRNR